MAWRETVAAGATFREAILEDQVNPPLAPTSGGESPRRNKNKKLGVPGIQDVAGWFATEASTVQFLKEQGILDYPTCCPRCNLVLPPPDKKHLLRCQKRPCVEKHSGAWKQSVFKGTFLENRKKGPKTVMFFLYHWLLGATNTQLSSYLKLSNSTTQEYSTDVAELVATIVIGEQNTIGGPGVVVEIDESKFGKRKHHRGHRVEGAWVFGGVELTTERRVFAVIVERRDEATLLPLIKQFIAPGSIIRSDCWSAYQNIELYMPEFNYEKVNHSDWFVDPVTGVHTNTIEGTWGAMKRGTPVRKRTKKQLQGCLFEFIWRRRNEGNLWNGLLSALRDVTYGGPLLEPKEEVKLSIPLNLHGVFIPGLIAQSVCKGTRHDAAYIPEMIWAVVDYETGECHIEWRARKSDGTDYWYEIEAIGIPRVEIEYGEFVCRGLSVTCTCPDSRNRQEKASCQENRLIVCKHAAAALETVLDETKTLQAIV